MSDKQDRQAPRNPTQLEHKYGFGRQFAEVMGVATDAQQRVVRLDAGLTQEEIMNRLTNHGAAQGIYRTDEGEIFMNGSYIKSGLVEADRIDTGNLFAKNIEMTGTFEGSAMAYIPPTYADIQNAWKIYTGEQNRPSSSNYDLNKDGDQADLEDLQLMFQVWRGERLMSSCPGAARKKVQIRINPTSPDKTVYIYGTNQFGTLVESYIGIDNTESCFATREYLDSVITVTSQEPEILFRNALIGTNFSKEYFNPPMKKDIEYPTIERWLEKPVYTQIRAVSTLGSLGHTIIRKGETVAVSGVDCVQIWYVK